MFSLPWKVKLERRPRPLPPEFDALCQMVAELAQVVDGIKKMAEATQRKVYRDADKDNGGGQEVGPATLGTTAPAEADLWRTGDPAN